MKVIVARLWFEPAVVFGLLASVALFFVLGGVNSEGDLIAVLTPFATSLGIRQVVTPVKKLDIPEDEGDPDQNGTI